MSYQVYFADLSEENRALMLALLRLKEEAGTLEPGETDALFKLRGGPPPERLPDVDEPPPGRPGGGGGGGRSRRGSRRGGSRSHAA